MDGTVKEHTLGRRYGELDLLRALAIVLMVLYHLAYDLKEFVGLNVNYQAPSWFAVGKTAALTFIFLSGLSSGLSHAPVKRGLKVFLCGLGVTAVTYLFLKDEYVRFGILHFLGVAMILSPLLFSLPSWILLGLVFFSAGLGFLFNGLIINTGLLLPLGLKYPGFSTIDYFPIFPYIAVTILGVLVYRFYYAKGRRALISADSVPGIVRWLSRKSLIIYLAHQPIILLILFLLNYKLF